MILLDFWTYGCINCLHVLSELHQLEQKYGDRLMVIGIHAAKFPNERSPEHIQQAILQYGVRHPVLVDNDFQVWQAYSVKAWPTLVLIDPQGYVVASVAGEGHRDRLDQMIGQMLQAQSGPSSTLLEFAADTPPLSLLTPLAFPGKVLTDEASDRLYIADSGHHRLVVTTLEGDPLAMIGTGDRGWVDGSFGDAQFDSPQGMALDRDRGLLYVADTGNHLIRCINLADQRVETLAGTGEQNRLLYPHGGLARETPLNSPWDVELWQEQLFIAMAGLHQIWSLDCAQGTLSTYLGTGAEACVDGGPNEAAFAQPSGLAIAGDNLYVADSEGNAIRRIHLKATPEVETLCGTGALFGFGDRDGQGLEARLQHCMGIAYQTRTLWLADTYNHKIKRLDLDTNECQTFVGHPTSGLQDGQGDDAHFFEPSGLSATATHLYVADSKNHAIRCIELQTLTVTTLVFPGLCAPTVCFRPV